MTLEPWIESTPRFQVLILKNDISAFNLKLFFPELAPPRHYTAANIDTKGACLERMRKREFGRTTKGCGKEWDSVRPWDCDDVVKAHFVRERNLRIGRLKVEGMR